MDDEKALLGGAFKSVIVFVSLSFNFGVTDLCQILMDKRIN